MSERSNGSGDAGSSAPPASEHAPKDLPAQAANAVSKFVPGSRMDSIRNRIVLFAALATLVPSGVTLWLSYVQNRNALEEKTTQDLVSASSQSARALGVSLKQRLFDLRIFANSNEVSDNLDRAPRASAASQSGRLNEYLRSLHGRSPDFARLAVVDLEGRAVASSTANQDSLRLPTGWANALRSDNQVVGDASWNPTSNSGTVIVAVPVHRSDGRLVGAFAAELNLRPLQAELREFSEDTTTVLYLIDSTGAAIASSRELSAQLMTVKVEPAVLDRLVVNDNLAIPYRSLSGADVVGTSKRVPQVRWAVVAEIPADAAFEKVRRFRNIGLLLVVLLLLAVTASAYRFGLIIARPLDRLTRGASEVASGNLDVDIPAGGAGEVGYLTTVFNEMVVRLRESREEVDAINETLRERNEELARLSLTDTLTGLPNRRNLVQRLAEETARSKRTKQSYSVMMADVDRFKQYNDTFGHPAGDEVLKKVANILRESVRTTDLVARYGGEEFCIMLAAASANDAMLLAERIRARIAETDFSGQSMTLSLGVASYPENGASPEAVIAAADEALYQAKRTGRNRVERWTNALAKA